MEARDYILQSAVECERLERQADLHGRERVFAHVQLAPGQVMLDAGCGSGSVARAVARRFPAARVVGVDLNPDYVSYARTQAAAEGTGNVEFVVGNLESFDFPAASFDVVWSQFVLYFVPDAQLVLREFARVAKAGGRVAAATHELPPQMWPVPEDIAAEFGRLVATILGGWKSVRLPGLLAAAGLVDIDLRIEYDTIYSKLPGPLAAANRRNLEEALSAPLERLASSFGGPDRAQKLLADWIAHLERPETTSVAQYWVASGRKSV